MKRVVIVGAGPCGLVALKEMLDGGHDAILFERSGQLGGVFSTATAYPNMHLTISNWQMAFSDFPDPSRLCYSSAEEYLGYLQSYAHHFDLERHISYESEVCSATLGDDQQWSLEIKQLGEPEQPTTNLQADALLVATGSNQLPKPVPPGLSGFEGRKIHSTKYGDAFKREVADKKLRVLVVGGGESGADIAAELSDVSPNVSVWLRRPPSIAPRYFTPYDETEQVELNKKVDFPVNAFLESASTSRISAAQSVYSYGFLRRILWNLPILSSTLNRLNLASAESALFRCDQATYSTKNQRMAEALDKNKMELLISPTIVSNGQTCSFQMPNGSEEQRTFDAIVLCTGFQHCFPWLHLPDNKKTTTPFSSNPRSWYLHCFPASLGQRLFFLGFARPHQGGIPAMAEMLSRYIALLLNGERRLPADYAVRASRDATAEREYYFLSPNLNTLVDYNAFLESVARRIGCEPRLPLACVALFNIHMLCVALLALRFCLPFLPHWTHVQLQLPNPIAEAVGMWTSPLPLLLLPLLWTVSALGFLFLNNGLLVKWWFYPHWSVWYRQRGPGAKLELLDGVLNRVSIWNSIVIAPGFVLMTAWYVANFYVERLLFSGFTFVAQMLLRLCGGARFREEWGGLLRPKLFALHDVPWRVSDLLLP